jgi:Rnl2 family RNA ligase
MTSDIIPDSVDKDLVFTPYASITNSNRKNFVTNIRKQWKFKDCGDWIVTEKIHGANYSLWTDGEIVESGRRGGFIDDEKSFYHSKDVRVKHEERVLLLFKEFPGATSVAVFGELCGGLYPGCPRTVPMIQKGVSYSPGHEFYAFDIYVDGSYVDYSQADELFARYAFIRGAIEFRGTFDEAIEYSHAHNADQSSLPTMLGLEPPADNVREGNVIRPDVSFFSTNGARVILKDKNSFFTERASTKQIDREVALTDEEQNSLETILSYVTEARLSNVLSKFGIPTKMDIGTLIKQLCVDSLDEFKSDTETNYLHVHRDIRRRVFQQARKLVVDHYQDAI